MRQVSQLSDLMKYSTTLTSQVVTLNSKIIEIIKVQQENSEDNWISVKQAAQILGITTARVRYQIKHNLINSKRMGEKILLVPKSDIYKLHK